MPQSYAHAKSIVDRLTSDQGGDLSALKKVLRPVSTKDKPLPPKLPQTMQQNAEALASRQQFLRDQSVKLEAVGTVPDFIDVESLAGNIENLVGFATLPIGVMGPLRVNGLNASGDFFIPMATTEGAMLASFHRGAYVISQSGGASALCLDEYVTRAPCFIFESLADAGLFTAWVLSHYDEIKQIAEQTTRFGKLVDLSPTVNGKSVYLLMKFTTGDAAGQNMVTVASEAACHFIVEQAPQTICHWYLEGNLSGDKKTTMLSFLGCRGKKVVAEAVLKKSLVRRILHSTPEEMVRYCRLSTLGGVQSGSVGVNGHYANGLVGIFIACGQDAACVSEASVGITDMEVTEAGDLYVSVSLPNLIVGTVGGGTHLPTARECLEMMDCYGVGKARKFAEICAAAVLAGEISIIAALTAGHFGKAHATLRHKS